MIKQLKFSLSFIEPYRFMSFFFNNIFCLGLVCLLDRPNLKPGLFINRQTWTSFFIKFSLSFLWTIWFIYSPDIIVWLNLYKRQAHANWNTFHLSGCGWLINLVHRVFHNLNKKIYDLIYWDPQIIKMVSKWLVNIVLLNSWLNIFIRIKK